MPRGQYDRTKPRVAWVTSEIEKVAAEAARVLAAGMTMSHVTAVKMAQGVVLPPERRRNLMGGMEAIRTVEPAIQAALKAIKAGGVDAPRAAPPPPPETPTDIFLRAVGHPAPVEQAGYQLIKTVDQLATDLAEQFAKAFADRFQVALERALVAGMQQANQRAQAELKQLPGVRAHLPKVAIIGLLPDQVHMIEQEFKEMLDVRCHTTDYARGRGRIIAHGADVVVLMTKFISHDTQESVKPYAKRLELVSGGMTALRECLENLYLETAK